jgi:amino acid transporter
MGTKGHSGYGLRRRCLSFVEVLAQSIAGISPTSTSVLVISLVFASAGNGTWLAYLLATIGLMLVSLGINQFAKRSASPGAFFVYIGQALGRR